MSGEIKKPGKLPLVSIQIPAYNHEQYIKQCLDSILLDDYPNKELVIIDDGSSDGTASIIEKWIEENKPVFCVKFKKRENRGVTKTINELIKECRGQYIVSIASDDYFLPGGIKKRVEYLLSNPSKKAVFGDCRVVDKNDNILHDSGLSGLYNANKKKYFTDEGLLDEILCNWSVPGPVLMVNKTIYEDIGCYNTKLIVEDWDIYMRMAFKKLIGYSDCTVSSYRVHDNNTCSNPFNFHIMYKQRVKALLYNFKNIPFKFYKKALYQLYINYYLAYIYRKK